jgi:hypothetical protein
MIRSPIVPKQRHRAVRPRLMTQDEIARLFPNYPKPSQVKTFFAAMGRTIASWQSVETGLYEIYRTTTVASRPGAEACAFFSITSFRAKLNLTNAAVIFALHGHNSLLSDWKTLANRVGKKSDRRNEIVHGAVWTEVQEERPARKVYIGPNIDDYRAAPKRKPGQDIEPLTLERVSNYGKDFQVLAGQLYAFVRRIPPP